MTETSPLSEALYDRACDVLPGGVSSPVRAFQAVGGRPPFIRLGHGPCLRDVDGNEYVDLVMSWGPLIHGHAHPKIVRAVKETAGKGTSFGASTELEVRLAERVRQHMPSMELLRFVSSGTEAAMSALRLARAFTGRNLVVKFDGCYHGHVDALLVSAGSGALTYGEPTSDGLPPGAAMGTRVLPFNDATAVKRLMRAESGSIAAVIVEPVAGNMGTIAPEPGFLEAVRQTTQEAGVLLIFDEVITGFRLGLGGAQRHFGILPDLTCIGKIVGGGLPAAAFGGRREIMELLSPRGAVYQAGTLSGNPLAMAAGLASIELAEGSDYSALNRTAGDLASELSAAAKRVGVPLQVNRAGPMLSPFFVRDRVVDLRSARAADSGAYATFFQGMIRRGVYLPPSQYETWMLSFAHGPAEMERVRDAAREALAEVASQSRRRPG